MSGRNPRGLRKIVADSHQDFPHMETNLAKLKNLPLDDKSQNALLRSRIDEQSQLIMILKQRTDEAVLKSQTLERINKELEDFRESAQEQLQLEFQKYRILDNRFDDLANNHEELIKFKDEYKRQNAHLRQENERLNTENKALFSSAIEEKNIAVQELEKKNKLLREQYLSLESQHRELSKVLEQKEEEHKREISLLHGRLQDAEEKVKASLSRIKSTLETQASVDHDSQVALQQLKKEKDELLDLAMQRGRVIQEKVAENKLIQKSCEDMQKKVKNMQDKFEREAAQVNANLLVQKLKSQMSASDQKCCELEKEFEAYKKHTGHLLQKERNLNAKLRHLAG